jgi:hypothetical protein
MKVYCVFRDYDYEGKDLKHIFAKEEDADVFIASKPELYVKKIFYVI